MPPESDGAAAADRAADGEKVPMPPGSDGAAAADRAADGEGVPMPPGSKGTAGGERAVTLRELLARLRAKSLFPEGDAPLERIAEQLRKAQSGERMSYYVRALVAFGAWVAAVFFIAFLFAAEFLSWDIFSRGNKSGPFFGWGLAFILSATVLRRFLTHIFPVQLALALSMAGHLLVLAGAYIHAGEEFWSVPLAAAVLCAVLYPLYRDSTHRFLSVLLMTGTLTGWLLSEKELHHYLHLLIIAEAVGAGALFTRPRLPAALRPLAYALAVSLCQTAAFALIPEDELGTPGWPSGVAAALGLAWLYQWIAGGSGRLRKEPLLIAVAVTLALAASTPGLIVALGLVALGYARDERMLLGLGIVFLPVFIALYYYSLNVELIVKSGVLIGSGGALLLARAYLGTRPWARPVPEGVEGGRETR